MTQLKEWFEKYQEIYSEAACLLNEHIVGYHLVKSCRNYGPLFTHSTFCFESFNGDLLDMKNGSKMYQSQMFSLLEKQQFIENVIHDGGMVNSTPQGQLLERIGAPVTKVQDK